MARKNWQVFLSPMTAAQIHADELAVGHHGLLEFRRDGAICAQFTQYMGWFEEQEAKPEGTPAAVLTLVPMPAKPPGGDAA
jgi:hypothetical protein